jgi:hypothetical protein
MTQLALSTLRTKLRVYLNDTGSKIWTSNSELDIFINQAIVKFTTDVPKRKSVTYTSASGVDGDTRTYPLPEDFVRARAARGCFTQSSRTETIMKVTLTPGMWQEGQEPAGYIVDFPETGYVYFPREPDGDITFLYVGFESTALDEDTDKVDIGRNAWGEQAILAYAAYLAFNPSSARRAQLEQWNRKADQNVDNPLEQEAKRWLAMYQSLIADNVQQPQVWEFIN